VQLHALAKFFFFPDHLSLLTIENSYLLTLLAAPAPLTRSHNKRNVGIRKINKDMHNGSRTSTKHHRKMIKQRPDPLNYDTYGSYGYKRNIMDKEKLDRRKEGKYAHNNLHEFL